MNRLTTDAIIDILTYHPITPLPENSKATSFPGHVHQSLPFQYMSRLPVISYRFPRVYPRLFHIHQNHETNTPKQTLNPIAKHVLHIQQLPQRLNNRSRMLETQKYRAPQANRNQPLPRNIFLVNQTLRMHVANSDTRAAGRCVGDGVAGRAGYKGDPEEHANHAIPALRNLRLDQGLFDHQRRDSAICNVGAKKRGVWMCSEG